jgi:hypothetical protein
MFDGAGVIGGMCIRILPPRSNPGFSDGLLHASALPIECSRFSVISFSDDSRPGNECEKMLRDINAALKSMFHVLSLSICTPRE